METSGVQLTPDEARIAVMALTHYKKCLFDYMNEIRKDQKTLDEVLDIMGQSHDLILKLSADSSNINTKPHPEFNLWDRQKSLG